MKDNEPAFYKFVTDESYFKCFFKMITITRFVHMRRSKLI